MEWQVKSIPDNSCYCVCCLAKDVKCVYLNKCSHFYLLDMIFGSVLNTNYLICLRCHKVLLNFHKFKLQVEESVRLISHGINLLNTKKLHSLSSTNTDIYSNLNKLEIKYPETSHILGPESVTTCKNEPCSDSYLYENSFIEVTIERQNPNFDYKDENLFDDTSTFIEETIERQILNVDIKEESEVKKLNVNSIKARNAKRTQKELKTKDKTDLKLSSTIVKTEKAEPTSSFAQLSTPAENNVRFSCEQCGRLFKWRCLLKRHFETAHVYTKIQCPHCPKVFKNELTLRRHVESIHEKKHVTNSPTVQCPVCQKMFKLVATLRRHLKTIHRPDDGKIVRSQHMQLDIRTTKFTPTATEYGPFALKEEERYCVECNKLFKSQLSYKLHVNTSVKHVADKYECHDCGKKFALKGNLVAHIQRLHLRRRQYKCGDCGKQFFRRYLRELHERHSHWGEPRLRNHACALCDKAFTHPQVLKRHMLTHSGVRPHQCPHCPSKFTQKSTLTTHCKFKHKHIVNK